MSSEIAGAFTKARPVILDGDRPVLQATKDATLLANGTGYQAVAAGQSAVMLGASGAVGDYLAGVLIVPASLSPGAVTITDGNGSAITIFAGGSSSLLTLHSFYVQIGAKCTATTTPGWQVTTGSSVSVICFGSFT